MMPRVLRAPLLQCVLFLLGCLACRAALPAPGALALPEGAAAGATDFVLVREGRCLPVVVERGAGEPVRRAAEDFAADLARVSGLGSGGVGQATAAHCVLVGRVGAGGLIDRLIAEKRLGAGDLAGQWEATHIEVLDRPLPGVERALVIAGSDERGVIFGLYDLSRALGVSPWHWWADVTPRRNPVPALRSGAFRQGPPAVQYRGIFINDEDWGLQPWAAKTHEPEAGDIGPKTYARVCELLLRLRANTLWPAMHHCTAAFNSNPENARVAARHGIVMGSSHAEPMLRNNVREWTADPKLYDYTQNREGVLAYWEQRVRENAGYENLWTLGMRGIHDSAMQGAKGVDAQRAQLERIFADQRALLDRHVAGGSARAPQVFCAYKEVLEVYRSGLVVPPGVLLMWPDDNFGFIRNLPSAAEAARPGGNGIYYHLSYLGRPLSYLWLNTTPPALIWEEMTRAWRHGARREWILNVGDIKPAELGMEFFLGLAWDADRRGPDAQPRFLREWAAREFGAAHAGGIAALMELYYNLNYTRRPEHLQGWLPGEKPRPGPFTPAEAELRLADFARLRADAERIAALLPADRRDAFFQLVLYPARGSAAANQRFLAIDAWRRLADSEPAEARVQAALAWEAHRLLEADTRFYNEGLAGGKWRHFMALEPADKQWKGMRIEAPVMPPEPAGADAGAGLPEAGAAPTKCVSNNPLQGTAAGALPVLLKPRPPLGDGLAWQRVDGLGRRGDAVALMPSRVAPAAQLQVPAQLEAEFTVPAPGPRTLRVTLLPTHPVRSGETRRLGVLVDGVPAGVLEIPPADGGPEWTQAVLAGVRRFTLPLTLSSAGTHRLMFSSCDAGLVLDLVEVE